MVSYWRVRYLDDVVENLFLLESVLIVIVFFFLLRGFLISIFSILVIMFIIEVICLCEDLSGNSFFVLCVRGRFIYLELLLGFIF